MARYDTSSCSPVWRKSTLALGVTPVGAVRVWRERRWYPNLADLLAGVTPVGDEDDLDFEGIAALKPDLIAAQLPLLEAADVLLYFTWDDGSGRARTRERETSASVPWRSLKAVRAGRAFPVDDGLWNTSGGLLAARRVLEELSRLLH